MIKDLLEKFNKAGIKEENEFSEFPPFMQKNLALLGLKKDIDYTVTSDNLRPKLVTFNTQDQFEKAIRHFKSKGLQYRTEGKTIILEAKEKENKDYRDIENDDKLTVAQKLAGKRVKIKVPNAYGSTGVVIKYDEDTDDLLVRIRGANFISVSMKDVDILNPNEDPK